MKLIQNIKDDPFPYLAFTFIVGVLLYSVAIAQGFAGVLTAVMFGVIGLVSGMAVDRD